MRGGRIRRSMCACCESAGSGDMLVSEYSALQQRSHYTAMQHTVEQCSTTRLISFRTHLKLPGLRYQHFPFLLRSFQVVLALCDLAPKNRGEKFRYVAFFPFQQDDRSHTTVNYSASSYL